MQSDKQYYDRMAVALKDDLKSVGSGHFGLPDR